MSTYNESDHARDASGKYAPKATSETDTAVLDDGDYQTRVDDAATLGEMTNHYLDRYPDAAYAEMECQPGGAWVVRAVRDRDGATLEGVDGYGVYGGNPVTFTSDRTAQMSTPYASSISSPWHDRAHDVSPDYDAKVVRHFFRSHQDDIEPGTQKQIYGYADDDEGGYRPPGMMGLDDAESITLSRSSTGNYFVSVDKHIDDFGAMEERHYPGYCSDRQELIEAYAQRQWGASLDNASDWDHQRITWKMPTDNPGHDAIDSALITTGSNFSVPSHARFEMERDNSDADTLFRLQHHLDTCDERSKEITKALADNGYEVRSLGVLQARFRHQMATTPLTMSEEIPEGAGTEFARRWMEANPK